MRERFERLEETVHLALHMWANDSSPFDGRHYHLQRPLNHPPPLRKPHPPILIGGVGEHKTLRLVAQYADACNLFDTPDGGKTITHKLDVLSRHCEAGGRPVDGTEKTVSTRLDPGDSPQQFAERCAGLAQLGIDHAVVITADSWSEDAIERLAAAQTRMRS
jgi:alkanesulfonate monooxygenase SsuD/methylene tetrahydromethanopterin reductase-like flavin-dependent oxidoreductase (luciferase family)